ncbi:MAG TPA: AAA family ATPase, partial [Candidatus Deferrimicrobium sp.]|nr:AAA family ATPase [Candidatus Deferrimicrobium sp.]
PDSKGRFPSKREDLPKNSYKQLFENLAITQAGEEYLEKIGKNPVIFVSFKNVKDSTWDVCWEKIRQVIIDEYSKHYYLLSSIALLPNEKDYFKRIIDLKGSTGDYQNSLGQLLKFLYRYYETRVVILIDEYDAAIHSGYTCNYYDKAIDFMRGFLCGGLKDTDEFLEKSVITGILRIAKESIFSGLNNPGVYTVVSEEFSDKFGFTESEVESFLTQYNLLDQYDEVRRWYNGYRFGDEIIYNPWSIINFLESKVHDLKPYWLNTSSNDLIDTFLSNGGQELKEELEQLIRGEAIEKLIDENIIMKEITSREDLLWSFLLMTGYLKFTAKRKIGDQFYYNLAIPNAEVRIAYKNIIRKYFADKIKNKELEIMLKALIAGDISLFEKILQKIVTAIFSYHDFSGEPERVYHALVTGLLVWLWETHEIKSNRESGFGRYDIMIIPKDPSLLGYVIEFKAVDDDINETVPAAVEAAFKQIDSKEYETELIERGIRNIKKLAIVFSGKRVFVKEH